MNLVDLDLRCTRDRSHICVGCAECKKYFVGSKQLKQHSTSHLMLQCAVPGCVTRLSLLEITPHFQSCHSEIKTRCAQCGLQFSGHFQLDQHGEQTMHAAYVCHYPDCGSESSRIGDLHRHQLAHKKDVPRYPCLHCRK